MGKVKQVSVDTRQPAIQVREAKHNAVTQAMAVMIPFTSLLSASILSEINPREAMTIQCNTFAFSSSLSYLARCLIVHLAWQSCALELQLYSALEMKN